MSKINYKAKKNFGQNFLKDSYVISKIVDSVKSDSSFSIVEIGPGLGALTKELVKLNKMVYAFEIDKEIVPVLLSNIGDYQNIKIINEDILKTDLSFINNLENPTLVSNLPYYITSPIIELFIKKLTNIKNATFMVQKEVADRLTANVNTKDYNAFTISLNYRASVKRITNVSRNSFEPVPNVDSAVIKISKRDYLNKAISDEFFDEVIYSAFKERRKMMSKNLSQSLNIDRDIIDNILLNMNLRIDSRAENLKIEEFVELSNELYKIKYENR